MRLRTDDDIYRARLVYLGPPGYTLPIQLSYAQYGVFVVFVPLFMFIHYLFTLHFDLFPAWEIALAIVATSFIFRHVDPDRPARMVIRTALTDWRTAREPVARAARSPTGGLARCSCARLSSAARRCGAHAGKPSRSPPPDHAADTVTRPDGQRIGSSPAPVGGVS